MPLIQNENSRSRGRVFLAIIALTFLYLIVSEGVASVILFLDSARIVLDTRPPATEAEVRQVAELSAARETNLTPNHRAAAWQLGVRFGYLSQRLGSLRLSGTANQQQAQAALEPMLMEARSFANFLHLDATVAPPESQNLKELTNLSARIESDESGLAARIEQRVSLRHRHLFLFGMHVGVEMAFLDIESGGGLQPARAEIARHATLAGMPRNVWEPLSRAPSGATLEEMKNAYRAAAKLAAQFIQAGKQ